MAFWLERALMRNRAVCCVWGFVIGRHNTGLSPMDQEHTALSGFTLFLNLNNKYNMKLANLLDELIYFFDSETVCPSPVVQKPQQMPI